MSHRGRNRNRNQGGHRGPPPPPPPPPLSSRFPSTNMYSTLSITNDLDEDDEMNAHLTERFRGSTPSNPDTITQQMDFPLGPRVSSEIQDYFREGPATVGGGDWIGKPELPLPAEINCASAHAAETLVAVDTELPENKIEGPYDGKEDYLKTLYDLSREDATRPLRDAVALVKASPYLDEAEYGGNVGLYEPVRITSIVYSPRGLATRVAFSLGRVKKFVHWKQSKRLITGTLVALSPSNDCFQSKCVLATVAARPLSALDQNPPEIDLFFARAEDMEIDPTEKWIMVEARSSFYEASRHTMTALQHMMREPFPLADHLVDVQQRVDPPDYRLKNPHMDLSLLVAMGEEGSFHNVDILNGWPNTSSHGLDDSQSRALQSMLSKKVAIVQGPPGTGKTYVSVVFLRLLLANMRPDDPPIIVTCQTNHALDQLLRHVAEFEPNFIRLGGRSKDKEKVLARTLHEVKSNMPLPRRAPGNLFGRSMAAMKRLKNEMRTILIPLEAGQGPISHQLLLELYIITKQQADSLEMDGICAMNLPSDTPGVQMEQWLGVSLTQREDMQPDDIFPYEEDEYEVEQIQELEAEATAQDDDFDALTGDRTLLGDTVVGTGSKSDTEIERILDNNEDLYSIPVLDRGAVYNYFRRRVKVLLRDQFRKLAAEYFKHPPERKIGQWEENYSILATQRLIGLTTTGLSKYRGLIAALAPKIVLVEEAAETLEAPVAAACLPTLEHLVLVGDHQQLRPHCQVRALEGAPYHLNLSLFERLVMNEVDMECLTRQRRMIPEIRRLLTPIYNNLEDHPAVKDPSNRPPVEGMGGLNSFFYTHEWMETFDCNKSAVNEAEARMVVGFFDYLVLNKVDPKKITVLTFYNGQRKRILKLLLDHPNLRVTPHLNVATVDSYQGEENDIVLLSLVRSNNKSKIGFLSVDNRVCVALSRARRGFYMFGNGELLACESAVWGEVIEIMWKGLHMAKKDKRRHIGYLLRLQCSNHGRRVYIQEPEDWQYINGGCDKLCRCTLPCGHTCMLHCHPFANDEINCTQKCLKRISCGHPCSAYCSDPCRCTICDSRSNGQRPVLRRPTQLPRGNPPLHSGGTIAPSAAVPLEPWNTSENISNNVADWHVYANGGIQAEDAEFIRRNQAENAKLAESLAFADAAPVNLDPSKAAMSSAKESLLIDVEADDNRTGAPSSGHTTLLMGMEDLKIGSAETSSSEVYLPRTHENNENAKPQFNLLD
ncbi:hypothetical protein M011DRAFT_481047 [Sporormia fimetaria CBS 119925]|uniref:P-loop containing nucleoside triphosphate hydrolase protein n=1 Tax=Sporormia fimetaria CBS 119925 TaxID=1340428 RepID=A0A6A6UZC5_9PLEO|nr:hypothetical protein M011DRAFT_481047 [Sporormia fimetaria CBS 119925]